MASPTDFCFGNNHGQNIKILDRATATWEFQHSDGMACMEQPLRVGDEIHVTFTGSGHAELGIAFKDPAKITSNSMRTDRKAIVNVRIHKRETLEVVRLESQGDGKTVKVEHKDGKHDNLRVGKDETIWLMVILKFGDVHASLKSTKGLSRFHRNIGDNLEITSDQRKIFTKYTVPDALCYLKGCLWKREEIHLQISPVLTLPNNSPPSQFSLTIGYSMSEPSSKMTEPPDALMGKGFEFFRSLDKKRCNDELHIGINNSGVLYVFSNSRNVYYAVRKIKEEDIRKGIFIIFQLYRTRIKLLQPTGNCLHDGDLHEEPPIISDSIPYLVVTGLQRCEEVERSLEQWDSEKETVSLIIEGWSQDIDACQMGDDYLTPRYHPGQYREIIYNIATNTPTEHTYDEIYNSWTSQGSPEEVHNRLVEKLKRLEERMTEESRKSAEKWQELVEYKGKLEDLTKKMQDLIISRAEDHRAPPPQLSLIDIPRNILSNAPVFIRELQLFPLCDYLLSKNVIAFERYRELFERSKASRTDSNREFMMFLTLYNGPWDAVIDAFRETKQEHLLAHK